VLEHVLGASVPGFLAHSCQVFDLGQFGVTLFLLVSGFIIPTTLERGGSNVRFWINRLFRLFPLYWSVIAAYGLYLAIAAPESLRTTTTTQWLVNLTMLQEFVRVPHVLGVFWTLTLELAFYGACSVLFALGLSKRTAMFVLLGMMGLLLAAVALPLAVDRRFPGGWAFLFLTMFVGTAFRRCATGELSTRRLVRLLACLAVVAVPVAYVSFAMFRREGWPFTWHCVVSVWGAAYLAFAVAYRLRDWTPPGWLCWLGRVSYSIYLVHTLFIVAVPATWPIYVYAPTVIGGTLLTSALSYRFIEQPAIALGRRLLATPKPAAIPMRRAA
jgi:peptidoglycan/LPS O-acetylase OafA/YrhL